MRSAIQMPLFSFLNQYLRDNSDFVGYFHLMDLGAPIVRSAEFKL